ncbi:MAG: hypothetical protein R3344_01780, partial [Acidobacteriota bacterium]|nr:hypothetical protein [Acidobacteriota bacterium]
GIYEGTVGTWYNHIAIDCNDGPPALTEEITPAGGQQYYLLVPHSQTKEEGSYGTDLIVGVQTERPPGGAPCSTTHSPTPCP